MSSVFWHHHPILWCQNKSVMFRYWSKFHFYFTFVSLVRINLICKRNWKEPHLRWITHFKPIFHFYTSWKSQKTVGFLIFSGGIEMEDWFDHPPHLPPTTLFQENDRGLINTFSPSICNGLMNISNNELNPRQANA